MAGINDGRLTDGLLLFLEHPSVFTLGRRGGLENLCVSKEYLEERNIPMVQVERGGNITYHGPGQLVVYPIVRLRTAHIAVVDFVTRLEEVMCRIAGDWHIAAGRDERNRGVWVGDNKLGSVGINVRRGVTFHGLALNVNTDLTPFRWMNPCGLKGVGITSMEKEYGSPLPMGAVRESARRHFSDIFSVHLKAVGRGALEERLNFNE